jgi:diketogulonate reductase-like aldo/keto reductase
VATKNATKAALEAGFRQLDTSERYRTEKEVGEAMQEVFQAGKIKREDVFVATKLWNNNHRPQRDGPACHPVMCPRPTMPQQLAFGKRLVNHRAA